MYKNVQQEQNKHQDIIDQRVLDTIDKNFLHNNLFFVLDKLNNVHHRFDYLVIFPAIFHLQ